MISFLAICYRRLREWSEQWMCGPERISRSWWLIYLGFFFIWRNNRNAPHIAHAPGCCSPLRVYLHDVKWTEKKKESKSISDWRNFSVIVTHYGGWSSPFSITLPSSHRKRTSNFFISIFCEFNREEIDIKNHDFAVLVDGVEGFFYSGHCCPVD